MGLKSLDKGSDLTTAEREVLDLITKEFLTLEQIKIRRHCSKQAVYKIIKKLKKKGALNKGLQQVDYFQSTSQPNRLHSQELNIKILYKNQKYINTLKKSNLIYKNGHTIRLYKDSIEIYAGEGISFFGEDESRATMKSLVYWKKFITGLENELGLILLKNRVQNIRLVNHHYATIDSKVTEDSTGRRRVYKVYSDIDGKLIFLTDDSFNLKEHETVHPVDSKIHSENVNKQVNDWCNNNPPTNSELLKLGIQQQGVVTELLEVQKDFKENLKLHMQVLRDMSKTMKGIDKGIGFLVNSHHKDKTEKSLFKSMEKKYKKKLNGNQKTLGEFK